MSASYLNNGVNNVKRDFRDELTDLINERIKKDLNNLGKMVETLKDGFSYDINIGECPVGWDVHIYFKKEVLRKNISFMLLVANTIAKSIGVNLEAHNIEWENVFDFEESFTKIFFCADVIPYRDLYNED